MEVKIQRFDDKAVIPFKAYDKDFCYDLVAVSEEEIAPNVWKYRLGWGCQIKRDKEKYDVNIGVASNGHELMDVLLNPDFCFSVDIRPRSSIWKTGMVMSNSVGTVK